MLKPPRQPYGFKNLLAYQKADELQAECTRLTSHFPLYSTSSPSTPSSPSDRLPPSAPQTPSYPSVLLKTIVALADQMNRSARSAKQNIVEGWKRNSTKEYYEFLGFSIAANTELEEDCNDILNGRYPELIGVRGVMGEKGERGRIVEMGKMGLKGERGTPSTPTSPYQPPYSLSDVEKLPFYPLDKTLPPIVQLKLKCKELNFLLNKLQKSLEQKMLEEKTLPREDLARKHLEEMRQEDKTYEAFLKQHGLRRLENGRVVKDDGDGKNGAKGTEG